MPHLTADQCELLVGDALQQVPVVGDHNQRARPSIEQVFHHGEHIGVQIVAGLVHDEHVRLVKQNQQQLHAALLTTGEIADRVISWADSKPRRSINCPGVTSLPSTM